MTKYTLIVEHEDLYGKPICKSTHEFHADTLSTVLENTELFLRGAGFYFDGNLDIIKEEDEFENDDHTIMFTAGGVGGAGSDTITLGGAGTPFPFMDNERNK